MENITAVLDLKAIQEKANEYAMKGAIESIKEYYSGYNSPFRKKIDEELKNQSTGPFIKLPDIIAVLNESLSKEVDEIANAAIAKTFVPMIKRFLTRENAEMSFSEFLREFIELTDSKSIDDVSVDVTREAKYSWITIEIRSSENDYRLTLHQDHESKKEGKEKYHVLSLPENYSVKMNKQPVMKMSIGDATLEIPFTRDILRDNFTAFIARLVLSDTKITMDRDDFSEDMFPEQCHCE